DAANTRWEIEALEASLEENAVFARLAAPAAALEALSAEILARWPGAALSPGDANLLWQSIGGFHWAHAAGPLVKIALAPGQVVAFAESVRAQPGARGWVGAGGNTGYLSLPEGTPVASLPWPAVTLRGEAPLWPGPRREYAVMRAVKSALDPANRFPTLDE